MRDFRGRTSAWGVVTGDNEICIDLREIGLTSCRFFQVGLKSVNPNPDDSTNRKNTILTLTSRSKGRKAKRDISSSSSDSGEETEDEGEDAMEVDVTSRGKNNGKRGKRRTRRTKVPDQTLQFSIKALIIPDEVIEGKVGRQGQKRGGKDNAKDGGVREGPDTTEPVTKIARRDNEGKEVRGGDNTAPRNAEINAPTRRQRKWSSRKAYKLNQKLKRQEDLHKASGDRAANPTDSHGAPQAPNHGKEGV